MEKKTKTTKMKAKTSKKELNSKKRKKISGGINPGTSGFPKKIDK